METPVNISDAGLVFISGWEGLRNDPYNDAADPPNCTVGVGHLLHAGPCDGGEASLTDDECYALMRTDVQRFVDALNQYVTVPISQNQADALIDFAFNNGEGALAQVAGTVNVGGDVCAELRQYVHAGGVVLDALVRRREAECTLWNTEDEMTQEQLDRLANVEAQVFTARRDLNDLANGQDALPSLKGQLRYLWALAGKTWPF